MNDKELMDVWYHEAHIIDALKFIYNQGRKDQLKEDTPYFAIYNTDKTEKEIIEKAKEEVLEPIRGFIWEYLFRSDMDAITCLNNIRYYLKGVKVKH